MFTLGLDLGQAQDYTALCVVETAGDGGAPVYHVRHLERFRLGTSYPAIVERVKDVTQADTLRGRYILVADATGVGAPVVDLLRQANVNTVAVTITGGDTVIRDAGDFRVPKRDLVSSLQVLLQAGRLKFAEGLPDVPSLVREMLAFQRKITDQAYDTYGAWRDGAHDDMVLSVALAVWYAGRSAHVSVEWV
jgi:hypothetical protein